MPSRLSLPALAGIALALAGCSQTGPLPTDSRSPVNFKISDAVHSGGNAHFFFLPPLVPEPNATGSPDGSLSPVVEVCEWSAACGPVIASFSTTSGTGASTVRQDQGNWLVNWDTKTCVTGPCILDPAKTYRIRVLVAGVQLGFADVDVVSNGSQLKNVQTSEYIGLVNGRTLPVKFRIEVGAIHVVPVSGGSTVIEPAQGGTVATADGKVVLEIPASALSASTTITVTPETSPPDPTVVPGTTVSFGPDGTQFSQPVQISLAFDPSGISSGVSERQLRLFTYVNGRWKLVAGSRVDEAQHRVMGAVSHFSAYAVGALPQLAQLFISLRDLMPGYASNWTNEPLWDDLDGWLEFLRWLAYLRSAGLDFTPLQWIIHPLDLGAPVGTTLGLGIWMLDSVSVPTFENPNTYPHWFGGYEFTAVSSNPAIVSVDSIWTYQTLAERCAAPHGELRYCSGSEPIAIYPNGIATVAGMAWLSGRALGQTVVTVFSEGQASSTGVEVRRRPWATFHWDAAEFVMTVGQTAVPPMTLLDAFGQPADPAMVWASIGDTSVVVTDSYPSNYFANDWKGTLTARSPGVTSLTALSVPGNPTITIRVVPAP